MHTNVRFLLSCMQGCTKPVCALCTKVFNRQNDLCNFLPGIYICEKVAFTNEDAYCREIAKKIIAGKWTLHITFLLGKYGTFHFGELDKLCPSATQATFAWQLDWPEQMRMVKLVAYP